MGSIIRVKAYQIFCLHGTGERSVRQGATLLWFGLSRQATIVYLEIRGRKDDHIRRSLVTNTLKSIYDQDPEQCHKEWELTNNTTSPTTKSAAGIV